MLTISRLLQSLLTTTEEWSIPDAERYLAAPLASGDAHSPTLQQPCQRFHLALTVAHSRHIMIASIRVLLHECLRRTKWRTSRWVCWALCKS